MVVKTAVERICNLRESYHRIKVVGKVTLTRMTIKTKLKGDINRR